MDAHEWDRIRQVLEAALELEPDKRESFIQVTCAEDQALGNEVVAYLDAYEGVDLLSTHAFTQPTEGLPPGQRIGAFRVIRLLGQGGMGTVYLAERADGEYHKRVAIKVVAANLGAGDRFEQERQILAQLEHPNIVRLLDAGKTPQGLPYLVMDYVDGIPIDQYCDEQRLNTVQRLKLFGQVCQAVEYAHRNLVVHRDIKPSNILVTPTGEPKLLDFGIARLILSDQPTSPPHATMTGFSPFTPRYASPEQILRRPLTTLTDVYSLGVLLYELLTGHRPYRATNFLYHQVLRAVVEEDPEKPSQVIERTVEILDMEGCYQETLTPQQISQTRDGSLAKLQRRLVGDVDAIILKALSKEPEKRYSSIKDFAQDLQCYLEGQPIKAQPITWRYLVSKFLRRYPWQVAGASMILVALLGGAATIAWQAHIAETRFNQVRKLAKSLVFTLEPEIQKLTGATTARKLLVREALLYLDTLVVDANNNDSLQRDLAEAYQRLGDVQGYPNSGNLGDRAGAIKSYQSAIKIYETLLMRQPTNSELQKKLALTLGRIGTIRDATNENQQALEAYRKALEIWEKLSLVQPQDTKVLEKLFGVYVEINSILVSMGNTEEASKLFERQQEVAERRIKLDSEPSYFVWYSYRARGQFLLEQGNPAQAHQNFEKALQLIQNLSKQKPNDANYVRLVAISYIDLGDALGNPNSHNLGDWEGSLTNYQQALQFFSRLAKADPANIEAQNDLASIRSRMGDVLLRMDQTEQALSSYKTSLEIRKRLVNIDQTNRKSRVELGFSYQDIGDVLLLKKNTLGAISHYEQFLGISQVLLNDNLSDIETSHRLVKTLRNLAKSYEKLALESKVYPEKRLGYWYRAKEYFHQAFELLTKLQKQGTLKPELVPWTSEVRRDLIQCSTTIQILRKSTPK